MTSRHVVEHLVNSGMMKELSIYGVDLVSNSCLVVSPYFRKIGVRVIATNSVKAAFYLSRLHSLDVRVAPLPELIKCWCRR